MATVTEVFMPTYEYECNKCGHHFELFQSMTEPPKKTCPQCKGRVRRLIGAGAGLIFKGSGFYITDYRSESYKSKAKAETSGSTPAATPAAKPSEPAKTKPKGGAEAKK